MFKNNARSAKYLCIEVRLFTPLSSGEGLGVGLFLHKYTEMKLRCERHQITI